MNPDINWTAIIIGGGGIALFLVIAVVLTLRNNTKNPEV